MQCSLNGKLTHHFDHAQFLDSFWYIMLVAKKLKVHMYQLLFLNQVRKKSSLVPNSAILLTNFINKLEQRS